MANDGKWQRYYQRAKDQLADNVLQDECEMYADMMCLRDENAELREIIDSHEKTIASASVHADKIEDDLEERDDAIRKYAKHKKECLAWDTWDSCVCGYAEHPGIVATSPVQAAREESHQQASDWPEWKKAQGRMLLDVLDAQVKRQAARKDDEEQA